MNDAAMKRPRGVPSRGAAIWCGSQPSFDSRDSPRKEDAGPADAGAVDACRVAEDDEAEVEGAEEDEAEQVAAPQKRPEGRHRAPKG